MNRSASLFLIRRQNDFFTRSWEAYLLMSKFSSFSTFSSCSILSHTHRPFPNFNLLNASGECHRPFDLASDSRNFISRIFAAVYIFSSKIFPSNTRFSPASNPPFRQVWKGKFSHLRTIPVILFLF